MLVDSIVKAVMEADGVQTAALLRAIGRTPKSPETAQESIRPFDQPNIDAPP
jgi:hypothetical protein